MYKTDFFAKSMFICLKQTSYKYAYHKKYDKVKTTTCLNMHSHTVTYNYIQYNYRSGLDMYCVC